MIILCDEVQYSVYLLIQQVWSDSALKCNWFHVQWSERNVYWHVNASLTMPKDHLDTYVVYGMMKVLK